MLEARRRDKDKLFRAILRTDHRLALSIVREQVIQMKSYTYFFKILIIIYILLAVFSVCTIRTR